mmetsp:Transcript_5562/g.15726  ORF Transcript_5562/g.15726 Transcript_5562/m.15726 type:complete len:204 (+) Transcript_5562:34-645(+)
MIPARELDAVVHLEQYRLLLAQVSAVAIRQRQCPPERIVGDVWRSPRLHADHGCNLLQRKPGHPKYGCFRNRQWNIGLGRHGTSIGGRDGRHTRGPALVLEHHERRREHELPRLKTPPMESVHRLVVRSAVVQIVVVVHDHERPKVVFPIRHQQPLEHSSRRIHLGERIRRPQTRGAHVTDRRFPVRRGQRPQHVLVRLVHPP